MDATQSLGQIRHILANSRDRSAKDRAVEALLPHLWDRWPPTRYSAFCALTTRIYLPFGLHPMEWMSFPRAFGTALRLHFPAGSMPETHEERRTVIAETLLRMLRDWIACQWGERSGAAYQKPAYFTALPNTDMGADICEAIGRLGIYEAEKELLNTIGMYRNFNTETRTAALIAMGDMPPGRLPLLWQGLREQPLPERRILAAAITYINQQEAVPLLIEILNSQADLFHEEVSRPILRQLGLIGDVRALPVLTQYAREGPELLRPTAQTAIRRLMKEAQGLEEVTLVRASALATLNQDTLLRPVHAMPEDLRSQELLRPTSSAEDRPDL